MNLARAQNITTVFFMVLMFINTLGAVSLFDFSKIVNIFLETFGIHLSIIIAYYFVQKQSANKAIMVSKFKLVLLLMLITMWNGLIMGVTIQHSSHLENLEHDLSEFTRYADFLIAGGIIWLYNGNQDETIVTSDLKNPI